MDTSQDRLDGSLGALTECISSLALHQPAGHRCIQSGEHTVNCSPASTAWSAAVSFGTPKAPGIASMVSGQGGLVQSAWFAQSQRQAGNMPTLWQQQQQQRECKYAKRVCRCPVHSYMHRHAEFVRHAVQRWRLVSHCQSQVETLNRKVQAPWKRGRRDWGHTHVSQAVVGK